MATAQELAREGRRESLDPRAARTRAAILQAVHSLAAEGVRAPSVREIAVRAGVSRSSFYTQFASMAELSIALFEEVLAQITDQDSQARESHTEPAAQVVRHSVELLVEHVHALRHLYRMDLPETAAAHQRLVDDVAMELRRTRGLLSATTVGLDIDVASTYLAGGIVSLLRAWVTEQVSGTTVEITEQIMMLLPAWLLQDTAPHDAGARTTGPDSTEAQGPVP